LIALSFLHVSTSDTTHGLMALPTPEINIENFDHFEENENKIKIGEKTKRVR